MTLIDRLVSLALYQGKVDYWHHRGKAGEELSDLMGSYDTSNQSIGLAKKVRLVFSVRWLQ